MVNIDKIKELAKRQGISITYLCSSIGQGAYYFNDVKRRNGDIPDSRLAVIAELLSTTTDYLRDKSDCPDLPSIAERDLTVQNAYDRASEEIKLAVKKLLDLQ